MEELSPRDGCSVTSIIEDILTPADVKLYGFPREMFYDLDDDQCSDYECNIWLALDSRCIYAISLSLPSAQPLLHTPAAQPLHMPPLTSFYFTSRWPAPNHAFAAQFLLHAPALTPRTHFSVPTPHLRCSAATLCPRSYLTPPTAQSLHYAPTAQPLLHTFAAHPLHQATTPTPHFRSSSLHQAAILLHTSFAQPLLPPPLLPPPSYMVAKQPRMCSNRHRFCHTCIVTWTLATPFGASRCPTCRVDAFDITGFYEADSTLERRLQVVIVVVIGTSFNFPISITECSILGSAHITFQIPTFSINLVINYQMLSNNFY